MGAAPQVPDGLLEQALRHLRITPEAADADERAHVGLLIGAARAYVRDRCGVTDAYIEARPDLVVAVLAITSELYDERGVSAEAAAGRGVAAEILALHDYNLVPGQGVSDGAQTP